MASCLTLYVERLALGQEGLLARTQTHTPTYKHTHTHTNIPTHTTQQHTHTHTHAHTHTHHHTNTHTHTHPRQPSVNSHYGTRDSEHAPHQVYGGHKLKE